jgi:hypothetical protein
LGDDAKTHKILINGKALPITASLYMVLRYVQANENIPYYYAWVDGVCIN